MPTQVEDGNFRPSTRLLEHRPVTSPPTNQKEATHPAAFTLNFAYKNFSPKTISEFGGFEHEPPILLAWPCNKTFSAPNSDVSVCLASLCLGRMNLCSVTRGTLQWGHNRQAWQMGEAQQYSIPSLFLLSSNRSPEEVRAT